MKNSGSEKPKEEKAEIDFSKVSPDDIAKRFLDTPPTPKKKKEKDKT